MDYYNNTVASMVRAIQEGQSTDHIKTTEYSPRRPSMVSSIRDGVTVVSRGRRRDASFASPASRVSRSGSEVAAKNGRSPVNMILRGSQYPFEEKEMFFRPFARAPKMSNEHAIEPAGPRTPSTSFEKELQKRSVRSASPKRLDGAAEFLTARTRLRSIVESRETNEQAQDQDLTLDDLGSMLDDAIGQQAAVSAIADSDRLAQYQHLEKPVQLSEDDKKSQISKHGIEPDLSAKGIEIGSAVYGRESVMSNNRLSKPREIAGSSGRDELLRTSSDLPSKPTEILGNTGRRGNAFKRYDSKSQLLQSVDKEKRTTNTRIPADCNEAQTSADSTERDAGLSDRFVKNTDGRTADHPSTLQARRPQYHTSNKSALLRSARDVSHHRPTSPTSHTDPLLIPLALPQLVETHETTFKPGDTGSKTDEQQKRQDEHSLAALHKLEGLSVAVPLGPIPNELEPSNNSKSVVDKSLATQASNTPELPSTECMRPSKWSLIQQNRRNRLQEEAKLFGPEDSLVASSNQAPRPSIIESRIHDLLAASKQQDDDTSTSQRGTINVGKIKQHILFEGVACQNPIDPKKIAELQIPISEQADDTQRLVALTKDKSIRAPNADHPADNSISQGEATMTAMISPMTPVRGRSKVKQSFSPHGLPYAIEQRFSLSPSRSQSRHGNSGVFVSVEVRGSPEKSKDGRDEHEVIVRASVEPDDIVEDSDE